MRLKVLLAALLVTSACATPSPVTPSEGTWRFSGSVSAMAGERVVGPLPGAQLTVVSGVNTNTTVTSDAAGRYSFEGLESGRFTVAIEAPGFVSATPVIDLYRDIEVDFALTPQ